MIIIRPTDVQILTSMVEFLRSVLPSNVEVDAGLQNNVSEPANPNFALVTQLYKRRLRTNIDTYADTAFTASSAGNVLTVSEVDIGVIASGATLLGPNVVPGTTINGFFTGTGADGTYKLSAPQNLPIGVYATGVVVIEIGQEIRYQIDFHGDPAEDLSGDWATTVSALFRDQVGADFFSGISNGIGRFTIGSTQIGGSASGIAPLYADDPSQRPYVNENKNVELRWSLDAKLQANQYVIVPQQFFDNIVFGLINVDAVFPPLPPSGAIGSLAIGVSPIGVR